MTDVLIKRELLERLLYVMDNYVTHETPEEDRLRAILAQPAAPADGEAVEVAHHALLPALRQYMHNDGSGLLAGYDYDTTARIVAQRDAKLAGVVEALLKTAKWIEELPVPTVGAAGQLVKIDAALAAAGVGDE